MINTALLFRPRGTCLSRAPSHKQKPHPRACRQRPLPVLALAWEMTLPEASLGPTLSGVRRDFTPKLRQPMSPLFLGEQQRLESAPFPWVVSGGRSVYQGNISMPDAPQFTKHFHLHHLVSSCQLCELG